MMQKHERKARRMLEHAGFKVIKFDHNRAHGEFTLEIWGQIAIIGCSSSPKNTDHAMNAVMRDARRIKRELKEKPASPGGS